MMDRRRFLLTVLAGPVAVPLAAGAQPAGKVYRVGMLGNAAQTRPKLVCGKRCSSTCTSGAGSRAGTS